MITVVASARKRPSEGDQIDSDVQPGPAANASGKKMMRLPSSALSAAELTATCPSKQVKGFFAKNLHPVP